MTGVTEVAVGVTTRNKRRRRKDSQQTTKIYYFDIGCKKLFRKSAKFSCKQFLSSKFFHIDEQHGLKSRSNTVMNLQLIYI